MIKLRILRRGKDPRLYRWAQQNHKGPHEREGRRPDAGGNRTKEAEVGATGFEDGRRGHEPRNKMGPCSWKRQGIRFLP